MRNNKFRKSLVIGLILLFVGVAIVPGLNADVKTTSNNDTVEITIELCGLKEIRKYTSYLTQEELKSLEQLFNNIEQKLNQIQTRSEKFDLFNNAVLELNNLGLLPQDTTVSEVQNLVTRMDDTQTREYLSTIFDDIIYTLGNIYTADGQNQLPDEMNVEEAQQKAHNEITNLIGMLNADHQTDALFDRNLFCLITGNTTNSIFVGPVTLGLNGLFYLVNYLLIFFNALSHTYPVLYQLVDLFTLTMIFIIYSEWLSAYFSDIIPISIGSNICFGVTSFDDYPWWTDNYPSRGWVHTIGLNGIKNWEGNFYGNINKKPISLLLTEFHPGAIGFTGIKIHANDYDKFIGSALMVRLGENVPNLPCPPAKPSGPTIGKKDKEYCYTFCTTDSNDENIYYCIDWGDDSPDEWLGPYKMGEQVTACHSWDTTGTHEIRASYFTVSSEPKESRSSEPLTIHISKGKTVNKWLLNPFYWNQIMNHFPRLKQIILNLNI